MQGNEALFLETIKEVEPSLFKKLSKLQNQDRSFVSHVSSCDLIKLNLIINPNKLQNCSKPLITELFGQRTEIWISVSIPFVQNLTPVFQFEKYIAKEFNLNNFSFPIKNEILDNFVKDYKNSDADVSQSFFVDLTQSDMKSCITDNDISGFSVPRTVMSNLKNRCPEPIA